METVKNNPETVDQAELLASTISTVKGSVLQAFKGIVKMKAAYQACGRDMITVVGRTGSWKNGTGLYASAVKALILTAQEPAKGETPSEEYQDQAKAVKAIVEGARYWARSFAESETETAEVLANAGYTPPASKEPGEARDPANLPTDALLEQARTAVNLLAGRDLSPEQAELIRGIGGTVARIIVRIEATPKVAAVA